MSQTPMSFTMVFVLLVCFIQQMYRYWSDEWQRKLLKEIIPQFLGTSRQLWKATTTPTSINTFLCTDKPCSLSAGRQSHFQACVLFISSKGKGKKKKITIRFAFTNLGFHLGHTFQSLTRTGALAKAEKGAEGKNKGIAQEEKGYNCVHPLPDAVPEFGILLLKFTILPAWCLMAHPGYPAYKNMKKFC